MIKCDQVYSRILRNIMYHIPLHEVLENEKGTPNFLIKLVDQWFFDVIIYLKLCGLLEIQLIVHIDVWYLMPLKYPMTSLLQRKAMLMPLKYNEKCKMQIDVWYLRNVQ